MKAINHTRLNWKKKSLELLKRIILITLQDINLPGVLDE